jgi:molybdenum cofactor cytidylyltransferase
VLLAAGSSRRWGAGNKLFAKVGGDTMLTRTLAIARAAPAQRLIVAVGWQAARVAAVARGRRTAIVRVARPEEGLGASLRAVHAALMPYEREVLLFLGDMPWINPAAASRLVRAARSGDAVVRPAWRGRPGHPVLLRGPAVAALARSRGGRGPGREAARLVPGNASMIADVDRPGRVRRQWRA